jgi:hypothetical protein
MDDYQAITILQNLVTKVKMEIPNANYKRIDDAMAHIKDNSDWEDYDETNNEELNYEEELDT